MNLCTVRVISRYLYGFPGTGLPRIGEAIRRRVARWASLNPDQASILINDFCGDLRFNCDLSEHMGSQIFFRGSYSGGQLLVLRKLLSPTAVFVDAGANQGEFTICAAGAAPDGHIFSFEPVPASRALLERNVEANSFNNVSIFEMGLSNFGRDAVPIFGSTTTYTDGTNHIGLPTIFDVSGRSKTLALINLRRLDDVLPENQRVDVIKVDVEGAEFLVFQGAEGTIVREKPAIIFEANAETCQAAGYSVEIMCDWLKDRGYSLDIIGSKGELTPVQNYVPFCNILARHSEAEKGKLKDNFS